MSVSFFKKNPGILMKDWCVTAVYLSLIMCNGCKNIPNASPKYSGNGFTKVSTYSERYELANWNMYALMIMKHSNSEWVPAQGRGIVQ